MKANVSTLLLPLLILGMLILVFFKGEPTELSNRHKNHKNNKRPLDPSRFLIRPSYSQGNEITLALNGGELPTSSGQVPSIVLGNNRMRTVHLAWLHDWTKPECRASFQKLQTLYFSQEGRSLPALRIYLLPVYSEPVGEALHRAMLQVFFRANSRDSYITIANEISAGTLPANANAIRKHVETTDPTLFFDWDTKLEWLESDIEKTLSIARVQQACNAAINSSQNVDQLTSMQTILPSQGDQQELIRFIQNANDTQRAWLRTFSIDHEKSQKIR